MSKGKDEQCLPYLSRVKAFESTLLTAIRPPLVGFEHTGVDKSDVGVAGQLVDRNPPAKPIENNTQDGHEDCETEADQSEFEVEGFETLPFCIVELCHCRKSTDNNATLQEGRERLEGERWGARDPAHVFKKFMN
jgi:hypothetical protein